VAKFSFKTRSLLYIFNKNSSSQKQGLVMKKSLLQRFSYGFLALLSFACKKDAGKKGKSAYDSKFSFSYKGNHYELPLKEGTAEWGVLESGIFINRPDIFHGVIYFLNSNCAYLEPIGSSVGRGANCVLTQFGLPNDSSAVYIYSSGSVFVSKSNCQSHSEYDPYSGSTIQYDVCDGQGAFSLTLKNNDNHSIVITDGKLELYSYRR
jgi:hypothetical protein